MNENGLIFKGSSLVLDDAGELGLIDDRHTELAGLGHRAERIIADDKRGVALAYTTRRLTAIALDGLADDGF